MTWYRLSGAGNDFLAVVEPADDPSAGRIRALCTRGLSLGADGLFVLRRSGGDDSGEKRPPRVGMRYFNADGGEAPLCLNGTRCAARLAGVLGWAADEVVIETGAGPVPSRLAGDEVACELPPPTDPPSPIELTAGGQRWDGWRTTVGVPHLVLPWPEPMAAAPVSRVGPLLRRHPALGPAGANVSWVRCPSRHEMEIRTFERGVEAETLACGTGVLAAVAGAVAALQIELPVRATTRGGFVLTVEGEAREGIVSRWSLAGDARLVARIEPTPEAERLPAPPPW